MAIQKSIPIETLKQLLTCSPDVGKLYWKERPIELFKSVGSWKSWNTQNAGREAFTHKTNWGYCSSSLFKRRVLAHRVLWAMTHGKWPENEIDHINGNRADNRLENLREATSSENGRNKSICFNNTSGTMGVSFNKEKKRWDCYIGVNGKRHRLGYFLSKKCAVMARKAAEVKYGFHPNHGRVAGHGPPPVPAARPA